MVLGLTPLFGAVTSLIPATGALRDVVDILGDTNEAYELLTNTAKGFYSSIIGSNLELQQQIRQSAVVLASQLDVYDVAGQKIEDFTTKFETIGPRVQAVQREIELATRDIVGATDTLTNSILNQTINQFSTLQNQTKEYATELEAIPQLVVGLTSAFTTFQIPEFQVPQEIRSLLQGDLNNPDSQLARQLQSVGLTKELLEQAQASGTAIDLFNEKLSEFIDANASGADTIQNSFSIITDITEQLFRSLGEDPTEGLRKGLTNVVEIINDPAFEDGIKSISKEFGTPVGDAIESTFAKVVSAASEIGKVLDDIFDFEEVSKQYGKLLGDVISLTGDAVIGIGVIISTVVASVGKALQILDSLTNKLNGFLDLIDVVSNTSDIDILFNVASEEAQKEIEDFQRELDSKGPLRKFVEFIVSPLQTDLDNTTEQAISQVNQLFKQEFDRNASKQEFLLDVAAKIRDSDTSNIKNFTANLKEDLSSGIESLRDVIDLESLDGEVRAQIEQVLNEITSASQFDEAQRKIIEIIKTSAAGGVEVFNQYKAQLSLIDQTIEAAIARRDELTELATSNRLTSTERDELEKLNLQIVQNKELRRDISVALDPVIARQAEVINSLKEEGQATEEAEEQLEQLIKRRREAGDPATLGGRAALDLGASLVKVFNDLDTAISSYQAKVAKSSPQVAEDFERLSQTLSTALDFGAVKVDQAINLLEAAITDSTLPIEQRVAAEQQLIQLIQTESQLVSSTLGLEQQRNDLLVQRGKITSEEASVLNSQVQARQLEVDIAAKQNELAANRLLVQNGAKESIEEQLKLLKGQLETAEETDKILIQERINTQEKLLKDVEVTTQKQKQLEVDLEKLQLEKESLDLKVNELRIDEALAEIARERQIAEQEINRTLLERELQLAQERQGGSLVVDLDVRRQEGAIDDTRSKLAANELEILKTITEIEEIRNSLSKDGIDLELSKTKELQLQKQILDLENEGIKLNTDLINQQLGLEETLRQQAIDKQQRLLQLKQSTIEAEFGIEEANKKILQSILASEKASQKLRDSFRQLEDTISNIEVANINLELQGIDKVEALEERFKNVEFGSGLSIGIRDAIEKTKELFGVTNTGLNEQLRLIEERKQRELESSRSRLDAELDVINATAQQERLSLEIADLELQKEQDILDVKRLQLELEKDIIDAKLKSGDIDAETASNQIANLDRQSQSYEKISESLDIQRETNQKIRDDIGTIADNNEKIAKLNGEQEEKNIIISNETEKIDRNMKSIENSSQNVSDSTGTTASNTRIISQNIKTTSNNIQLVESTARQIEVGNFSLGNSSTAGSFDAGNVFGVDFNDFLDDYRRIRDESKEFIERNQGSFAGVGVPLQEALGGLDEINQRAEKAYLKAQIQFQDALSEARSEFRSEALDEINDENENTVRTFTDRAASTPRQTITFTDRQPTQNTQRIIEERLQEAAREEVQATATSQTLEAPTSQPLTEAQIITQSLAEIGRLSQLTQTPEVISEINRLNKTITDILTAAQNDPQIRAAQSRLATLLATPNRTSSNNQEIQELLAFIDEATTAQNQAEDQKVTATTLIEAINSGAFQAGSFTPQADSTILQNPETGEIIIGGTRLDETQLDTLFEVKTTNSILSQIEENTNKFLDKDFTSQTVVSNTGSGRTSTVNVGGQQRTVDTSVLNPIQSERLVGLTNKDPETLTEQERLEVQFGLNSLGLLPGNQPPKPQLSAFEKFQLGLIDIPEPTPSLTEQEFLFQVAANNQKINANKPPEPTFRNGVQTNVTLTPEELSSIEVGDPGPTIKERVTAVSVLVKPESALGAKLSALETLGFIDETQQRATLLSKTSGPTTSALQLTGFITEQQKALFDAGLILSDSNVENDSQANSLINQAGFASLEEGLSALNNLPSLEDFQGAFNAQVIPDIESLINSAIQQNQVFSGRTGLISAPGGSSGRGQTVPGIRSTVQNVTINNYPNNVGTTNSVLREGGL